MRILFVLTLLISSFCQAQWPATDSILWKQEQAAFKRFSGLGGLDVQGHTVASSNFDVDYYRCAWTVDPAVRYIDGAVTAAFTISAPTTSIKFDLSQVLTVDSVVFHDSPLSFRQTTEDGLEIDFPGLLAQGHRDSLCIYYQGIPVQNGENAFTTTTLKGSKILWTLSEPFGARDWWPCKNGLTDKADSIDLLITHPAATTASANGVLAGEWTTGSQTTSYFKHRYPIASYLVAMAVGSYSVDRDSVLLGGRQMPLLMYSHPTSVAYYKQATSFVKDFIQRFSNLYGLYPFYKEQYAQTQFGFGGGMEHQTNSFIVDRWPNLLAHELGHQWFGDLVTCGSWGDIWLNEGLATYTEYNYWEWTQPDGWIAGLQSLINSITSEPDGSVYVTDTTDASRIFSGRLSYQKGFYVIYMLRGMLGDSVFHRGLRRYLNDPALRNGFARTADLQRNLEAESGKDLGRFFEQWVYGEGYPSYQATWYNNANHWVHLKLDQTTSDPSVSFYAMPVQLVLKGMGTSLTYTIDHQYNGQEFWINPGFTVDSLLIDPDLWILAKERTVVHAIDPASVNQLQVYPNPAPEQVRLVLSNPSGSRLAVTLHNALGQLVYSSAVATPGRTEQVLIPVRHLPAGVYWLRLDNENGWQEVRKILH